jgi:hypothetical protein
MGMSAVIAAPSEDKMIGNTPAILGLYWSQSRFVFQGFKLLAIDNSPEEARQTVDRLNNIVAEGVIERLLSEQGGSHERSRRRDPRSAAPCDPDPGRPARS